MTSRFITPWLVRSNNTAERGILSVLEHDKLPFQPVRTFWITDMHHLGVRGGHAHREGHQLLVALAGQVRVLADGPGLLKSSWTLRGPDQGIWVPPMHWLDIRIWGNRTVLLVFASNAYAESDYIRDRAEFEHLAK